MLVHPLINGKIDWTGELDEWLAKAKQASGGAVPKFCLRVVTEKLA